MSDYILQESMRVITYPYHNPGYYSVDNWFPIPGMGDVVYPSPPVVDYII